MPLHRASVTDRRRPGARLIRTWALASIAYVAAAGALSVAPVREVMTQAARPAPLAPTLPASWKGPLPDAPDSPAVKVAKVAARQAVIAFAPPFLALWFGWDVWFAARGFLAPDRKAPRE